MANKQTILAFIDRIKAHDLDGLAAFMGDGHIFIDAHGNQVSGREKMIAGWRAYFEWFPDYYFRDYQTRHFLSTTNGAMSVTDSFIAPTPCSGISFCAGDNIRVLLTLHYARLNCLTSI